MVHYNKGHMSRRSGFTIVELAVTIAIIGILAAVGTFSFLAIQQQARDNQRTASAEAIANALERYYEENGEYPGCEAITADPSIVAQNTLKSIDTAALKAPKAAAGVTNSLSCQSLESVPSSTDIFSYTGDTSAACQTGPACAKWEIRYRMESGEIGSIKSRRTAEAIATTPTLTATATSISQINTSWTPAQDAVSYELQRSSTAGFSSPIVTSHTSLSSAVTGLEPDTTYYFRVRAILPSSASNWSAVVSASTNAIGVPTLSTSSVAVTTATASWTSVSGATSYQLERSLSSSFSSPTTTSHTTTSTPITGLSPGTTYYLRVRAVVGSHQGNWSTTRSITTTNVTAPTGTITISAAMSGTDARGTAGGGSCASGTTIEYQIRYFVNTGSYTGYTTGSPRDVAATEGYRYTFQAQARCVIGSVGSSWVASGTAQVVRPVATPTNLTISAALSGANAQGTAGATCASGTTPVYQIQYLERNTSAAGTWSSFTSGATRNVAANQGYQYTFRQQARCVGQFANSGWATSSTAAVVRPINAPAAPSVTVSGGGASSTNTYTRSNVSCPTGTTVRYNYRNLRDGGYTGSWYTITATSTSVNTVNQGYQYTTQMRAQCYTTYYTSNWGPSGQASYIRPVAADTAYSYNAWRDGNTLIYMRAYSTSGNACGPGASLYGRSDIYTYDWNWTPAPIYYGWRRSGAHGWAGGSHYRYYGSEMITAVTTANPTGGWWGSRWAIYAELRCQNSVTGRNSGNFIARQSHTLQP